MTHGSQVTDVFVYLLLQLWTTMADLFWNSGSDPLGLRRYHPGFNAPSVKVNHTLMTILESVVINEFHLALVAQVHAIFNVKRFFFFKHEPLNKKFLFGSN